VDESAIAGQDVRSDFLFARPSFGSGIARLLDLFGAFDSFNSQPTRAEADARAIRADWAVIGQDLRASIADFRKSHPELAEPR
jgi:hypothetical protein